MLCVQTDPEAAKIVFECGAPIVMLPIELTHTALVTPDVLERITAELVEDTPFVQLVKQLLLYFAESYRTVFKFDNPPLHDPCAVAYVIAPEIFPVSCRWPAFSACLQQQAPMYGPAVRGTFCRSLSVHSGSAAQ